MTGSPPEMRLGSWAWDAGLGGIKFARGSPEDSLLGS